MFEEPVLIEDVNEPFVDAGANDDGNQGANDFSVDGGDDFSIDGDQGANEFPIDGDEVENAEEQGADDSNGEEFDERIGVLVDDGIDEGATPGNANRYNLRPRVPATLRFNAAVDEPHNDKTYYTPTHLINADKHNLRVVVFEHILTQLTSP